MIARSLVIAALMTSLSVAGALAQSRTIGTVTTTAGPPPAGLTATPTSATSVTVNWNAMSGAKAYVVERRKTTDPACCTTLSRPSSVAGFTDNALEPATQYTFRVSVLYFDGSNGFAEVSATTPPPPRVAPVPDSYSGAPTQNVVVIRWSPVLGASQYSILRNGAEISVGGACSPTCVINNTGEYGATYSYVIETRFPEGSNVTPSRTPAFSVTIPHIITVPAPGWVLVARDSRVDIQITNTANPTGSRGGIVSGSGNGITVNDPGLNKLAMMTNRATPLGSQRIALNAANTLPASIDAIVMRTPGRGVLALAGVGAQNPPGTSSTLKVEQLGGPRWAATFNALPRIEFEREGDFGGATFCANNDAVGVVMSANGRKLGLTSPWGIILQELNRSPVPAQHILEARRFSSDGKTGLVPLVYLTPDCTLAVIVDVSDNTATPYRIRAYDLLTRQLLGTDMFAAAATSYDMAVPELFAVDNNLMNFSVRYPGKNQVFPIPHRSF